MTDIIESGLVGNLFNGQAVFQKKLLGMADAAVNDILVNAGAHVLGKCLGQVVFADIYLSGDLIQGERVGVMGLVQDHLFYQLLD